MADSECPGKIRDPPTRPLRPPENHAASRPLPLAPMLFHRLVIGVLLVTVFLAVLFIDEHWLAPWYPLWGLLGTGVLGWVALEMIGLLNATSARPSGNTVFGGVLAIALANWAPHVAQHFY